MQGWEEGEDGIEEANEIERNDDGTNEGEGSMKGYCKDGTFGYEGRDGESERGWRKTERDLVL